MGKAAVTAERGPAAPESSAAGQADRRLNLLEFEFGSLKQQQQEQTALLSDLLAAVQAMAKSTDKLRSETRQVTAGAPDPEVPINRNSSFIVPSPGTAPVKPQGAHLVPVAYHDGNIDATPVELQDAHNDVNAAPVELQGAYDNLGATDHGQLAPASPANQPVVQVGAHADYVVPAEPAQLHGGQGEGSDPSEPPSSGPPSAPPSAPPSEPADPRESGQDQPWRDLFLNQMLSRSNLTQRAPNQKVRDFWPVDAQPLEPAAIREAADKTGSFAKIAAYRQVRQHVRNIEHHINQLGDLVEMDPRRRAVVLDTIRHSLGKEFAGTFDRKLGRSAKDILKQDRRASASLQSNGQTVRNLFLSDKKGFLSIEAIVHYVIGHDVIRKLDLVMDTALQYIRLSTACEGHSEPTLQTYWDYCEETFSGIHAAERRLYGNTTPLSNALKNKFFIGGFPPDLQNLLTKFLKRNDVWVDGVKRDYYSTTDHGYFTIEHLVEATDVALETNNLELTEFLNSKGKGKNTRPTSDALKEASDRDTNVRAVGSAHEPETSPGYGGNAWQKVPSPDRGLPPPTGSYAYKYERYNPQEGGQQVTGNPKPKTGSGRGPFPSKKGGSKQSNPRWKQNAQRPAYGQNADWADFDDDKSWKPSIRVVRAPTQPTGNELPQQDDWARGIFRAFQSPQHIQSLFSAHEPTYGVGYAEACY